MAFNYFSKSMYLKSVFLKHAQYRKHLPSGERNFSLNNHYIYLLNRGVLKVYVNDMEGNERLLWLLSEGCVIPTFHTQDDINKQIVVVRDAELLMLTKEKFFSLVAELPDFFSKFMDQIYERYEGLIQNFINDSNQFSKVRFYKLLNEIALHSVTQMKNGVVLDDYLSRQDMASLIGTHTTNISKYLLELEKKEIVERLSGKRILIRDRLLLQKEIALMEEERLEKQKS